MTEQEIDKILSEQVAEPVIDSIAVQCDTSDKVDETPVHFDSEEFKKQICFDKLNRDKPTYSAQFKALLNVIGGVLSSKDKMRVSGRVISPRLASERFSKLRYDHVLHVLETYNKRLRDEKKPNDPRAYLLTMLYNSVDESDDDFMSAFGKAAPEHESSFDIDDLYGLVNNFPGYDYVPDTSCESSNTDFYIQAFSEKMNHFLQD